MNSETFQILLLLVFLLPALYCIISLLGPSQDRITGILFPVDPDSPDPFTAQDPPMIRLPDFAANTEQARQALELWREFFEGGSGPWMLGDSTGEDICFFCDTWRIPGEHAADCIYIRAKALFEGENGTP